MTPVKMVYEKYKHWRDENNEHSVTKRTLNKLLQERGYEKPLSKNR